MSTEFRWGVIVALLLITGVVAIMLFFEKKIKKSRLNVRCYYCGEWLNLYSGIYWDKPVLLTDGKNEHWYLKVVCFGCNYRKEVKD